MSKVLVLYKSKYGSARQYAEWLAMDLNADLRELSESGASFWADYTTIVFCGGVYANTINGMKAIVKKSRVLTGKKTVIIACGLSDPHNVNALKRVERSLYEKFPQVAEMNLKLFLVQGGVCFEHMSFFDRLIIRFLKRALRMKKPEALNDEERQLLAVLNKDSDFKDHSLLQPIVGYITSSSTRG